MPCAPGRRPCARPCCTRGQVGGAAGGGHGHGRAAAAATATCTHTKQPGQAITGAQHAMPRHARRPDLPPHPQRFQNTSAPPTRPAPGPPRPTCCAPAPLRRRGGRRARARPREVGAAAAPGCRCRCRGTNGCAGASAGAGACPEVVLLHEHARVEHGALLVRHQRHQRLLAGGQHGGGQGALGALGAEVPAWEGRGAQGRARAQACHVTGSRRWVVRRGKGGARVV